MSFCHPNNGIKTLKETRSTKSNHVAWPHSFFTHHHIPNGRGGVPCSLTPAFRCHHEMKCQQMSMHRRRKPNIHRTHWVGLLWNYHYQYRLSDTLNIVHTTLYTQRTILAIRLRLPVPVLSTVYKTFGEDFLQAICLSWCPTNSISSLKTKICLSCLLAGQLKKIWLDFHEIWGMRRLWTIKRFRKILWSDPERIHNIFSWSQIVQRLTDRNWEGGLENQLWCSAGKSRPMCLLLSSNDTVKFNVEWQRCASYRALSSFKSCNQGDYQFLLLFKGVSAASSSTWHKGIPRWITAESLLHRYDHVNAEELEGAHI